MQPIGSDGVHCDLEILRRFGTVVAEGGDSRAHTILRECGFVEKHPSPGCRRYELPSDLDEADVYAQVTRALFRLDRSSYHVEFDFDLYDRDTYQREAAAAAARARTSGSTAHAPSPSQSPTAPARTTRSDGPIAPRRSR